MKREKLKKYTKSVICVFFAVLCVLTMCISTHAEEAPILDFEGPYNAYEFSVNSNVFNFASMKKWTEYFELMENAGMTMGRKVLLVGAVRWYNTNTESYFASPAIVLSGITTAAYNENLPISSIYKFGNSSNNSEMWEPEGIAANQYWPIGGLTIYQAYLSDGSLITGNNTTSSSITQVGRAPAVALLMESGGLYFQQTSTQSLSAFAMFAKRDINGNWVYQNLDIWENWRAQTGDTSNQIQEAPIVNEIYNNLYEYVERTADVNVSYNLDIAGTITAYLSAANTIFRGFTDYEIFGISIGATLAAIIIATIIAWIVKKLKGW